MNLKFLGVQSDEQINCSTSLPSELWKLDDLIMQENAVRWSMRQRFLYLVVVKTVSKILIENIIIVVIVVRYAEISVNFIQINICNQD